MIDVTRARQAAMQLQHMFDLGQENLSREVVRTLLLSPFLELTEQWESQMTRRWLTLAEAMEQTGRSRNYFRKPVSTMAGRSRLEQWRLEGYADLTLDGAWLIHPAVLPAPGAHEDAPSGEAPETHDPAEADALAAHLLEDA
jgi:hypothetical protein